MDGGSVVAAVRGSLSSAAVRAMAFAGDGTASAGSVVARPADSLRVESAAAPERGLFETVLGSLLGFVL
jgi:hypothetical protein